MPASHWLLPALLLGAAGVLLGVQHTFNAFSLSESWLMVGSAALGILMLALLVWLRVSVFTLMIYAYLLVPFYANRLLGAVWLGSPLERAAGTVAPLLIGDAVLLYVIAGILGRFPLRVVIAAGLLIVPAVAVVLNDQFHAGAFVYQYLAILRGLLVAWVVSHAIRNSTFRFDASRIVLHLGVIFAVMSAVSAAAAIFTGGRFAMPGWGVNVFANALCVVAFLNLHQGIVKRRLIHLIVALVCVYGIIGSGTRFAFVVFLAAALLFLLTRFVSSRLRRVAVPVVVAGAMVLLAVLPGPVLGVVAEFGTRGQTLGNIELSSSTTWPELLPALALESSVRTRFQLWETSVSMASDQPLSGVGWGQWNWLRGQYGAEFDVLLDPHNGYLWLLAEGGVIIFLIGLAVAAWIIASSPDSVFRLAMVMILVLELTNSNLQKPLFAVMAGLIVGALMASRNSRSKSQSVAVIESHSEAEGAETRSLPASQPAWSASRKA